VVVFASTARLVVLMPMLPSVPVPMPVSGVRKMFPPFAFPDVSRASFPPVRVIFPPAAALAFDEPAIAGSVMANPFPAMEDACGAIRDRIMGAVPSANL
jgi:hypothetical protein